ncbi:Protein of unknown function DUF3717 [Burkholderiaceae bacterium]
MFITIQELEAAINFWRQRMPPLGEEQALSAEVSALAKPYALLIMQGAQRMPIDLMSPSAQLAITQYLATT